MKSECVFVRGFVYQLRPLYFNFLLIQYRETYLFLGEWGRYCETVNGDIIDI